jgi:RNA polymerase sigma-70 factor (ECF subfamily)
MATYREPLYLLLLRMTHNTTTASDLTVDTFSKAFCQLHRYAPTGSFSSWLFSIGVNTYIDYLRRRRMDTVPLSSVQRNGDGEFIEYQIPSSQPNPEESMMRKERNNALREVVQALKQPYRQIVEMRYYDELSYEQIAEQLDIPIGTVKIRLLRAKNLMQAIVNTKKSAL